MEKLQKPVAVPPSAMAFTFAAAKSKYSSKPEQMAIPLPSLNDTHTLGESICCTIMPVSPQPIEAMMCVHVVVLALPHPTPKLLTAKVHNVYDSVE